MLNFFIACIWLRAREVTGSSHVCHHCILCHILTTYIDSFLQMNNLMTKAVNKSVAMTKGANKGYGRGGWEEGGGMRT